MQGRRIRRQVQDFVRTLKAAAGGSAARCGQTGGPFGLRVCRSSTAARTADTSRGRIQRGLLERPMQIGLWTARSAGLRYHCASRPLRLPPGRRWHHGDTEALHPPDARDARLHRGLRRGGTTLAYMSRELSVDTTSISQEPKRNRNCLPLGRSLSSGAIASPQQSLPATAFPWGSCADGCPGPLSPGAVAFFYGVAFPRSSRLPLGQSLSPGAIASLQATAFSLQMPLKSIA